MGSSNSRLGARPSRPRLNRTTKYTLFSFLCGASSTSHPPIEETEDYSLMSSAEHCDPIVIGKCQGSTKQSSSILCSETECSSSTENGASSESCNGTVEDLSIEYPSRCIETSNDGKCLSERKELVPYQANADYSQVESDRERTSDMASSSSKERQSLESFFLNVGPSLDVVVEVDDSKNEGGSQICVEGVCSSSISHQGLGDLCADGVSPIESHADEVLGVHNSDSTPVPAVSDSSVIWQSLGDESAQETAAPGPGFLMSDRQQERRDGSLLHFDVVSVSSNILPSSSGEISIREARRNSRRLFWDAFSRRGSRRHSESPTIVFSADDIDDLGSHDRWLLDFSGDLFEDGFGGDSGYLDSRSHGMYERQWHSRSEIWERLRGGLDEGSRRTTCASGLHPDGTCLCESFLIVDESGSHESISRIVMLAEALFEVLDEIHHQPMSLSLSMVSLPAPESVVNSFPLKSHKKPNAADIGNDMEQCYICLAEYEEGDKIRVLPCSHEYHMSCVDKWLKEIHRVCPLCRRDVCEGATEGLISNS